MAELSLAPLVRKLGNHVHLDECDQAAILQLPFTLRSAAPLSYLVREGDAAGACAVLLSGYAFRSKTTETGARQIVSIHIPGEALDLQHLFLDCADHNVQALAEARVALIPRAALRELVMANPNIAHAVAVSNQVESSIFREWLLNVGRRDARQRLAHLMCELATRLEQQEIASSSTLVLPMTQEQLADATGLTSVHVNRTLMSLEKDGLISRSKRAVSFPDWEGLRSIAGFSDLYLHLGQQKAA